MHFNIDQRRIFMMKCILLMVRCINISRRRSNSKVWGRRKDSKIAELLLAVYSSVTSQCQAGELVAKQSICMWESSLLSSF